jgi:hypothetical protein
MFLINNTVIYCIYWAKSKKNLARTQVILQTLE